ncbi:MAG: hypothetical protein QMC95_17975 [Desulfitobacteriaceae bacterium]|nr:hypothetical protein [Bacillota bacterium]MDI6916072.1 hypothetical protein [Desulfitobacteriaceae bacterium]
MRSVWLWTGVVVLWFAFLVWVIVVPDSWTSDEVFVFVEAALILGMYFLLAKLVLRSKQKNLVYFLGLAINGLLFFVVFVTSSSTSYVMHLSEFFAILLILVSSTVYSIIVGAFLAVAHYLTKRKTVNELTSEDKRDE